MATLSYGNHTIDTGSTSRALVRRALATAEREDIAAAVERTGLPTPLIEKWCDDAEIPHRRARPTASRGGGTSRLGVVDVKRRAHMSKGDTYISLYKGHSGQFRLSAGAVSMTGVEADDPITFAQDESEERTHVYFGVCDEEASQAHVRLLAHTLGFRSNDLARDLGIYKPEKTRHMIVDPQSEEFAGTTFWKALLLDLR